MKEDTGHPLGLQGAVPGKGSKYHRVLQALAGMYGHDAHAVLIAFQPQQGGLFCCRRLLARRRQPVKHRRDIRVPGGASRDTLGKVQQVGEAPLAIGEARNTRQYGTLGSELSEHPHEAALPPAFAPLVKPREPGIPLTRIRFKGKQFCHIDAHQVGQQCAAQQRLPTRLGNGLQDTLKFHRLEGFEHAFVALAYARDTGCGQCLLRDPALGVVTHQDRDVLRLQRSIPQRGARVIQTLDLGGHRGTAPITGGPFGDEAVGFGARQLPDHH